MFYKALKPVEIILYCNRDKILHQQRNKYQRIIFHLRTIKIPRLKRGRLFNSNNWPVTPVGTTEQD